MVELSVIIPTLKNRPDIECLAYLEQGDFTDYEVIIRDDPGAAKARNEGIRRASADKLIFLDDDSRPSESYLAEAARVLEEEPVVAGRILHPNDDIFGRYYTEHYDHGSTAGYIDTFISCNMALRREVFDAVGLFDESFVWGHEEKELAERVREAYDIYYDPGLVVEHSYADSLRDFWVKRYRQETQRPYYWQLHGISTSGQLARTGYTLLRPSRYIGEDLQHTVAKVGVTLAVTLGRMRGLLDRSGGERDGSPTFDQMSGVTHEHGIGQES